MVPPTAIGHTSPFSFVSAINWAPKKRERIDAGVLPSRVKVIKAVSAFRRFVAPSSAAGPMRYFRCCGKRPSIPPLEPLIWEKT